jgi:hypothetical protein
MPRLKTFDWSQSVTIPGDALQKADHLHHLLQLVLWIGDHLLYLIAILPLAVALMAWRWRTRKMKKHLSYDFLTFGVVRPYTAPPQETEFYVRLGRLKTAVERMQRLSTSMKSGIHTSFF